MKVNRFDEVVNSIREEKPDMAIEVEASERVRSGLFGAAGVARVVTRIQSCDDYRGLIPSYLQKTISDSRRMLLEDHVRECIPCRHALDEARVGRARPVVRVMPSTAAPRRFEMRKWAVAAALLLTAGAGTLWTLRPGASGEPVATVDSLDGMLYQVSDRGTFPVGQGRRLSDGEELRAARGAHAVVRLFDGSLVEMNERADLSVSRGWKGTTIQLDRGNIIVQAAKQKYGKLFVASGDSLVSVKGTIFSVSRGTKGTRVSVVEGAVAVDQRGRSEMLKPGGQSTSDASLEAVPVSDDIAWSKDAARYLALLGELTQLEKKLGAIPSPALRYQSNLLRLIPADTVVYAAIPNAGDQLREARKVFEEQTRTNPVLSQWWSGEQKHATGLLEGLDKLQTLSTYVGDEVVLAVRADHSFTVLAEVRSSGVEEFLDRELKDAPKFSRTVHGNTLILSRDGGASRAAVVSAIDRGGAPSTPFRERIARAYEKGAGWLLCLDAQGLGINKQSMASDLGVDNLQYLVFERREVHSRTETTAALQFGAQRRGVASWLGTPGPLSTLDFVSPDAGVAFSFVTRNPKQAVEELLDSIRKRNPNVDRELADVESKLGIKLVDDLAGALGSEVTIAQDGPLLPDLSWKVALEVYAPQTLEHSIEKLVETFGREASQGGQSLKLDSSEVGGRVIYKLSGSALPMAVFYTFSDGYMIVAPAQSLLTQSIDNRRNGISLARSEKFRAQLPYGASPNFSALVYHNISQVTGPVAEQLKKLNVLTGEQRRAADQLADMTPGLIYVYGEPDRISISSSGGFFGMNLGVLAGLDRGLPFLIPRQFMPSSPTRTPDAIPKTLHER